MTGKQHGGAVAKQVSTVRGPIDVEDLGSTLMHEHVFIIDTDMLRNDDHWNEERRIIDATEKLGAAKAAGIDTIVDPTVIGLGRYMPWLQRVNAGVDINIIPATGIYSFGDTRHFFAFRGPGTPIGGADPMTELFLRDITEGIAGTGVRAAFLKHVVEASGLTPAQERIATAVCETHQETGVPITVHTNAALEMGRVAIEFYEKHNVDLTKVVIGHAGDSNDLDYLRFIADKGCIIGCDRFGLDLFNTTANRVATIAALCEEGYSDRIALSHDASCYLDSFPGDGREGLVEMAPNWHFLHITNDVLPALRERGVTDDQITQMLVENPKRYFG